MTYLQLDHIALSVESLRQAENFYDRLFGLKVCFREGPSGNGWNRWSTEHDWEEARETGLTLERSCLQCEGLRLLLVLGAPDSIAPGRINYVSLRVKAEDFEPLRQQAECLGCGIERPSTACLIIEDPYGMRWKVQAGDFADVVPDELPAAVKGAG